MPEVLDDCAGQLAVCAFRVCDLDADGVPVVGDTTMYVSNALAIATLKPVYEAGAEIKENNACGETLIDFLDDPTFVRADLDLDFITPDPYLHSILIANSVLLTAAAGTGWAFPPIGKVTGNGVSVEMWAKRIIGGKQSLVSPWAHWALPFVRSLQLGDRAFSGTAVGHSIITGQCNENAAWADGPGADFDAASDRVAQWIPATTIPATACGALAAAS